MAIKYRKPIIPLQIGETVITETYEYLLSNVQIKTLSNNDDYMELLKRCRLGEREVSICTSLEAGRMATIIKGDYQNNMSLYIEAHREEMMHTVFAIGIDQSGRLDFSSTKGILHSVAQCLQEKYNTSIEKLQGFIDRAKQEQLGYQVDQHLKYKDTVLVTVPIKKDGDCKEAIPLQLLLIANSKKNNNYQTTHDVVDVQGIDSREVVLEVFNTCRKLGNRARSLFIGAMGTNGLSFPYEVITAEILNCFAYSQRIHSMPCNLYYSIRKEDMERANLSIDEVMQYIATVIHFFED